MHIYTYGWLSVFCTLVNKWANRVSVRWSVILVLTPFKLLNLDVGYRFSMIQPSVDALCPGLLEYAGS